MKKEVLWFFVVSVMIKSTNAYTQSIAHAIGENLTVITSGAGDVKRNPALLSFENENIGLVGFVNFLLSDSHSISAQSDVKSNFISIENKMLRTYEPQKKEIGGGSAFFYRVSNVSFGMAISGNTGQEQNYFDWLLYVPAYQTNILFRNEQFQYNATNKALLACSLKLYENLSIGIQGGFAYMKEYQEEKNYGFTNGVSSSWEYKSTMETTYIFFGSIGMMMKAEVFQLGVLYLMPDLSSSKCNYENEKDDYNNIINSYSIEGSISNDWRNTSSFGILCGIAINITPQFVIVGETGFRKNGSYRESILIVNNAQYEMTDEVFYYQTLFLYSAGIHYILDHSLTIACGGFSRKISLESEYRASASDKYFSFKNKIYGIQIGFEKSISSLLSLIILGAWDRNEMCLYMESNEGTLTMTFDEQIVEYGFFINAAVRMLW